MLQRKPELFLLSGGSWGKALTVEGTESVNETSGI